jgi:hypothetical protein
MPMKWKKIMIIIMSNVMAIMKSNENANNNVIMCNNVKMK